MGLSIPADLDNVFPRDETRDPNGRFHLPRKYHCARAMPFNHIQLNHAASGHPGGYSLIDLFKSFEEGRDAVGKIFASSTYSQPHFDVLFHLDTPEESNQITCSLGEFPPCIGTDEEMARFDNVPSPEYAPASMMRDPMANIPCSQRQASVLRISATSTRRISVPMTDALFSGWVW